MWAPGRCPGWGCCGWGLHMARPAPGPTTGLAGGGEGELVCHLPAMRLTPQVPQVISTPRNRDRGELLPHLQMRQLRPREGKRLAHGHSSHEAKSPWLKTSLFVPRWERGRRRPTAGGRLRSSSADTGPRSPQPSVEELQAGGSGEGPPWAVEKVGFCSVCTQSGHRTQEVGLGRTAGATGSSFSRASSWE